MIMGQYACDIRKIGECVEITLPGNYTEPMIHEMLFDSLRVINKSESRVDIIFVAGEIEITPFLILEFKQFTEKVRNRINRAIFVSDDDIKRKVFQSTSSLSGGMMLCETVDEARKKLV